MKRIRCNKCGRIFNSEDDLELICEWPDGTRAFYNPLYDLGLGETVFRGCPECVSDGYLMDLDD